jgi:hypothetical protein
MNKEVLQTLKQMAETSSYENIRSIASGLVAHHTRFPDEDMTASILDLLLVSTSQLLADMAVTKNQLSEVTS